jgi:serine protease Do
MTLPRSARWAACLTLLLGLLSAAAPAADPAPTPVPKWDPARTTNPDDLLEVKSLQNSVNRVVEKCTPATVAIFYGSGTGSGVIINEDGLVLTAAHVIRDYAAPKKGALEGLPLPFTAGKKVEIQLADGTKVVGKTLGINEGMDSGMVQITTKGPNNGKWPFAPVGKSGALKKSQWVVTLGHPNGPKEDRPPVARLGRVIVNNSGFLRTDCAIVGGDSGGPLFDLNGNVVGIHSRMVFPYSLAHNIHVPTDDFRTDWDKLVAGDWVDKPVPKGGAYIGVVFPEDDEEDAWLREVEADGPADKGGLKAGDTITKFNETAVKSVKQFRKLMEGAKPGDKVKITARRGTTVMTMTVTLTKRA